MKKNEFNTILRKCSNKKGLLDVEKISSLDCDTKNKMINYIVRRRMAIVTALLNAETDMSWLHSMGYSYKDVNKSGFELLCTCENRPNK